MAEIVNYSSVSMHQCPAQWPRFQQMNYTSLTTVMAALRKQDNTLDLPLTQQRMMAMNNGPDGS